MPKSKGVERERQRAFSNGAGVYYDSEIECEKHGLTQRYTRSGLCRKCGIVENKKTIKCSCGREIRKQGETKCCICRQGKSKTVVSKKPPIVNQSLINQFLMRRT